MKFSNVLKIFKKDMKAAVKNPVVMLVSLLLLFYLLYMHFLNVQACWDPYGNTDNLNFAIVNNDENGTYQGENLAFGDRLVDKLKDNDDFNWVFVDENQA